MIISLIVLLLFLPAAYVIVRGRAKYKTGSRFALWRWTQTDSGYLERLHIVMCPWFSICLHFIRTPDPEPWFHDHPVTFFSLILRGGYYEHRRARFPPPGPGWSAAYLDRSGWRRWWNFVRASENDVHSIGIVKPHTVTLCFMGPVRRRWGYHTADGWVYWRDYNREKRERKAIRAAAKRIPFHLYGARR